VISAVWGYVFFGFIEPGLIDTMLEMQKEQMMDQQGMSASDVEQGMSMVKWMFTPGMFAVFGLLGSLIAGSIFSLIIAPFMKREA